MLSVSLLRDRGGRMQMTRSEGLLTNHSELAVVTRNQWEVEFSRFFNLPRWASGAPAGLRALPKGKIRSTGTWITSSSPALLLLHKPTDASAFVLSVNVQQYALEEHYVSSLLFSWPQVSCVSQCPVRGSRVIQKFAVRFPTCTDVEAFLAFVKECSRGMSESDFAHETSSQSEIISSNGLHYSSGEPTTMCGSEVPGLSYSREQPELPHSSCTHSICPGFPPSFADLLTNCSNDTEKEKTNPIAEPDVPSHDEEHPVEPLLQDASKQVDSMSGADIKSKIVEYMSDVTFHEMLFKLEKVIDELGGDLAL
ncbi:hypothetical protein OPV22_003670 [Ensete ventricosum]|uniref:Poor homologous synapsis 1 PH domain-containing protein n=1 Tax=Ensete ventricosum TaxID=4639 RepID=A0AAV8S1I2_ENSVE|nr:hypothetical protein OPV22_003670 [Ensete ventricosum]